MVKKVNRYSSNSSVLTPDFANEKIAQKGGGSLQNHSAKCGRASPRAQAPRLCTAPPSPSYLILTEEVGAGRWPGRSADEEAGSSSEMAPGLEGWNQSQVSQPRPRAAPCSPHKEPCKGDSLWAGEMCLGSWPHTSMPRQHPVPPPHPHLCQGHKLPDHRGHSSNWRRQLLGSLVPSQCPDRESGLMEPRRGQVEIQGQVGTKLP